MFETTLDGQPYQVVARLMYSTARHVRLEQIVGFVVNLHWIRNAYIRELTSEVQHISGTYEGLDVAVQDEGGALVAGGGIPATAEPVTARPIRPLFFDPALVAVDPPDDLPLRQWTVRVSAAGDPAHASAVAGARRSMMVSTAAAIAIGFGLFLTGRAMRASATLAELRADFVASVTHELKTPLATISVVAETLARGVVPEGVSVREYAQIVGQESKRLTRLVDNLLAYSRVTDVGEIYSIRTAGGGRRPRRHRPPFPAAVRPSGRRPPARHPRRPAAGGRRPDGARPGPRQRDRQRPALFVRPAADRHQGPARLPHVEIAVSDNGRGIPPDELQRVEQRFVRGRHAGKPGSGLGMAIASRIVRDHGGEFALESVVGRGTTVYLRLPVSEV